LAGNDASPDRDRISRHKLTGGDHAGLLALIEHVRSRAARVLGLVPAVVSCYEAGYDGFWLHRLLTAAGITNYVFDPTSIAVERRGRRAKTDRIDGEQLLRTLREYCRRELRVVRIVRVPSREREDARRDTREKERLTKEKGTHINRIKSLLRLLGMPVGNPRWRDWLRWLSAKRDWQGEPVPPRLLAELTREHGRLMQVREQLAALEQAPAAAELTPAAAEMARRKDLLLRLKSLGPAFSSKLTNEVFHKDFRNRREVGGYFGLDGSPWRSGETDHEQGVRAPPLNQVRAQPPDRLAHALALDNRPHMRVATGDSGVPQPTIPRSANERGRPHAPHSVVVSRTTRMSPGSI
jgi:transposase